MAKDPYKYFRLEARELLEGLTQGVMRLEQEAPAAEAITRLLRLAHTLKGAARVVRQPRIAELAHRLEDLLGARQGATVPAAREEAAALLALLDKAAAHLKAIDAGPEAPATAPAARPPVDEPFETVRVEIEDMDLLLNQVTEAGVQLGAVRRSLTAVNQVRDLAVALHDQLAARPGDGGAASPAAMTRARSISDELRTSLERLERQVTEDLERLDGDLGEARGVAQRLRLVPARTVFPMLERAVHDTAASLGRSAQLMTSGGDVRLDASVLAALRDALQHVVRNAVAHGIESETDRLNAGKPPAGQVRLSVERRGNRVTFLCQDDGRGIDVRAVRSAAVERGLVSAEQAAALDRDAVIRLVFMPGLTTHAHATELAGRGIGLDVARETVARLKGQIAIRSETGQGTAVEMDVPVSLASFTGLLVEAAGTVASIPLDAVQQTLRIVDSDIAASAGTDSIVHQGKAMPFRALETVLSRRPRAARRRTWSAIVVQRGDKVAAVGVDRVLGTSNIVMRSLAPFMEADPVVAGVSLDSEGNPQLVLDPGGLIEDAAAKSAGRAEPTPAGLPILVVDDSLTTRMLEKSILESAGFTVELATSAEEALVKGRDRRYGVFIVDVEMPGMDGFEFVEHTRGDPMLRGTPAILVTSRNSPDDLRRGEKAGARAYIVKSEFDQKKLLETIRALLG